jgi:hypothetical protein
MQTVTITGGDPVRVIKFQIELVKEECPLPNGSTQTISSLKRVGEIEVTELNIEQVG